MRLGGRSSKTLLYQEVIKELYRIIDQENLKPGDKLPAERELIEELNVSRNVLREAFHVLEKEESCFKTGKRKVSEGTAFRV